MQLPGAKIVTTLPLTLHTDGVVVEKTIGAPDGAPVALTITLAPTIALLGALIGEITEAIAPIAMLPVTWVAAA